MSAMKRLSAIGLLLLVACLAVVGCNKSDGKPDPRAFDNAPPEIKADWEKAVAADAANDYYTAATSYTKVLRQETKLTPKQFDTAVNASREFTQRMTSAAEKGDAAAKEAMRKLMTQNRP